MSRRLVRTRLVSLSLLAVMGLTGCHGQWQHWKHACRRHDDCECRAQAMNTVPYQQYQPAPVHGESYDGGYVVPNGPNGVPLAPPALPEPNAPNALPAPVLPGGKPMNSASHGRSYSTAPQVVYDDRGDAGRTFGEPVQCQQRLIPGHAAQPALFNRIGTSFKRMITPAGRREVVMPPSEPTTMRTLQPTPQTEPLPSRRYPLPLSERTSQQVSFESTRPTAPAPARNVRPVVIEGIEFWETVPGDEAPSTAPGTGLDY